MISIRLRNFLDIFLVLFLKNFLNFFEFFGSCLLKYEFFVFLSITFFFMYWKHLSDRQAPKCEPHLCPQVSKGFALQYSLFTVY